MADPVYWVDAFSPWNAYGDGSGNPVTVTFAILGAGTSTAGQSLRDVTVAERAGILDAIAKIDANINVSFVEGTTANADVVFGISDSTTETAYGRTYYFTPINVIAYDHPYPDNDVSGNAYIFKHELLHGMGLGHSTVAFGSTNPVVIPDDQDNGTTLFGSWSSGWTNDIQLFDLAALQYIYGPNPNVRSGNDVYTPNFGAYDPSQPTVNNPLLWDGGGIDLINLSGASGGVVASLEPGFISRINGASGNILETGTFSINYRTEIEKLFGSAYDDELSGNDLDNTLHGSGGLDVISGGGGNDVIDGGANGVGGDTASYKDATGNLAIYLNFTGRDVGGGLGFDTLSNIENLTGGDFNDRLVGDANDNVLTGGKGNDVLKGKDGNDTFHGGDGNDKLIGGAGDDTMFGGAGNDTLSALAGLDTLNGGDDDDFLFGGRDNDVLNGDAGIDKLRGNLGNDTLNGGEGDDDLRGGGQNDILNGGGGADFLLGENGLDILNGGLGNDALTGGALADTFIYENIGSGFDRIKDFENGIDVIDLTDFGFADFAAVQAIASDTATGLRIDTGGGNVLFVEGFSLVEFDVGDVLI